MTTAMHCALVVCWRVKYQYLRLRPSQLDPRIDVSVIPVPEHPSYPSGHSTAAGAAYQVLRELFPGERAKLKALAEESGLSRLKAGIHYRSDHTAGIGLGRDVGAFIMDDAAEDGGPQVYR
jgi:membrane-associated phospholipid phosphatase